MDLDRVYQPASLDAQVTDESGEERTSAWDAVGEIDPQIARIEERESLRRTYGFFESSAWLILIHQRKFDTI